MEENSHNLLRDLLLSGYESLRRSLARRLGSDAQAGDALHDVYLRLDRGGAIAVARPRAYLMRMALNAATDRIRAERRALKVFDTHVAHGDIADDAADQLRVLAAKQEIAELEAAINALTPRRRDILLASRAHGRTLAQIAAELGISQRMVEIELKHAVIHCAEKLGRPVIRRFGPSPRLSSSE
jgi:RNA polymerase sigma factor (sigma-70 family)